MSDQKQIWTFPVRLAQGKNWIPTTAVVGTTAGLMFLDQSESRYFRTTTSFNGFKNIVTGNAAAIGMGAVPASLYAVGLIRKDSKMQRTALFAGEALADTVLVQTALKDIARRVKPARYPTSGWFSSKGPPTSYLRGNGSFPSGHSMAAFSVATIVARQYGNHRWVPYVAYGLAAACRIFTAPAQCSFPVGCLHGWRDWIFDQPLHCAAAITAHNGCMRLGSDRDRSHAPPTCTAFAEFFPRAQPPKIHLEPARHNPTQKKMQGLRDMPTIRLRGGTVFRDPS